ncbi:ESC [Enterospora canceri]|uniref:ESC n=1 Tax=Enterospora canceri TaxID=1081671 RepID=A0A1Y1S9M3_9MICR|nr:ESC [Enterospora canceri]
MAVLNLKNVNLVKLLSHDQYDLMAAVGHRSIVILNSSLIQLSRYLDSDTEEKFLCAAFLELHPSWRSINGDNKSEKTENDRNSSCIHLAVAGESGLVKILNLKTGRIVQILRGHTGAITCIKTVGNKVITGSYDSSIRVWDVVTGECTTTMGGILCHRDVVLAIDIHRHHHKITSVGTDCTIREWELTGDEFINKPKYEYHEIHKTHVQDVRYYGDLIISLGNDSVAVTPSHDVLNQYENTGDLFSNVSTDFFRDKTALLLGRISLYEFCRSFKVVGTFLMAVGTNGEMYLFDLRKTGEDNQPLRISLNSGRCQDFVYVGDRIFITDGSAIQTKLFDLNSFR